MIDVRALGLAAALASLGTRAGRAEVEGLSGKAAMGKGSDRRITINMLDLYLSERVKELTGGQQTPTTAKPQSVRDFPVAVAR